MSTESESRVFRMGSSGPSIFPDKGSDGLSWYETIFKAEVDAAAASKQGTQFGRKQRPFDYNSVRKFRDANVHHSRCISTKAKSTVGLGFRAEGEEDPNEPPAPVAPGAMPPPPPDPGAALSKLDERSKAEEVLDPLCEISLADVMNDAAEDYFELGGGSLEIVRAVANDEILGIHHIPAPTLWLNIENNSKERHFEIQPVGGPLIRLARFGDHKSFNERRGFKDEGDTYSEVIHIRQPSSRSRWYGFPDWLSCVAYVELQQMLVQYFFDFFNNRGVPDFLLTVTGGTVAKPDWDALCKSIQATVGRGNQHKTTALNLPQENIEVSVHTFAGESKMEADTYSITSDQNAMMIVSAHGVPPLLAGIQIPGKLGANNELPNALMAFQALVIQQAQKVISSALANTLGNEKLNGRLSLGPDDFKFRKITDVISMAKMDTVSRMRQTVPEAKAEGRDLEAGLKKALEVMDDERAAALTAEVVDQVIGRLLGLRAA